MYVSDPVADTYTCVYVYIPSDEETRGDSAVVNKIAIMSAPKLSVL